MEEGRANTDAAANGSAAPHGNGAVVATSPATLSQKKELAERTLTELLGLMELPAGLDLKDAADGGISVSLDLKAELPGVQVGKRSHVVDALQFLVNKLVNKPGTPRHWVTLGVGGHAEPRGAKPARAPAPVPAPAAGAAPQNSPRVAQGPVPQGQGRSQNAGQRGGGAPQASAQRPAAPVREVEKDERSLTPAEDKVLGAELVSLAKKSAAKGRFFAIVGLTPEQRALALQATEKVEGVSLKSEGEGRNRRLVYTPAKPSPMPKRVLPMDDSDDEDEELA